MATLKILNNLIMLHAAHIRMKAPIYCDLEVYMFTEPSNRDTILFIDSIIIVIFEQNSYAHQSIMIQMQRAVKGNMIQ